MRTVSILLLAAVSGAALPSRAKKYPESYHVHVIKSPAHHCQVVLKKWDQFHRLAVKSVYITESPAWHECDLNGEGRSKDDSLHFYGPSEAEVWRHVKKVCREGLNATLPAVAASVSAGEVVLLEGTGDSSNRIDVVFMGDGYTQSERQQFLDDMQRLTNDMFNDVTFRSYLPVFNIWAVFIPSMESGIGTHNTPRNTEFGLYRSGTELRGVYTSKAQNARQACQLAPGCDYPSIIGNDPYYGGLGGEFVIGTQSKTTGTVVLRHEMGHNFISVGEEYDDGSVYRGVNSDRSLTDIKWSHWLTDPQSTIEEQQAEQLLGEYPWVDLATGRQTFRFTSSGNFKRWFLRFTLSGCDTEGSIGVYLDGEQLPWEPARPLGEVTLDRQFYTYQDMEKSFTAGQHTLEFVQLIPPAAGRPMRQLCSLSLNEYGDESTFKWDDKQYVGAYPTWDVRGRKTYRPQNEACLMRNMSSSELCVVCKEGMWWEFFMRMSAIDDIEVQRHWSHTDVKVRTVGLGQFREAPLEHLNDRLDITWTKDGEDYPSLRGYFAWDLPNSEARGEWVATVTYHTDEVRIDPNGLLTFQQSVTI